MEYSVAIVAIARLENPYINEWIEYHHKLGFDHFYVYDNSFGTEEHIDKVITHENAEVTTIIPAYNKVAYQKLAYTDAYKRFNSNHDYMLFIDIDEFFTLCKHKDVSEYIDYLNGKCPGFQDVRIHWEMYDDNNAIERDLSIPVHKFFTQKSNTFSAQVANGSAKCMVKTKIGDLSFGHVHFPRCIKTKLKICDSVGNIVHPKGHTDIKRNITLCKIRHYATKTISEYMNQKLKRGDADGYIVRTIENRFFIYVKRTSAKMAFYHKHKIKSQPKKQVKKKVEPNMNQDEQNAKNKTNKDKLNSSSSMKRFIFH